jgi:hypothetical protein
MITVASGRATDPMPCDNHRQQTAANSEGHRLRAHQRTLHLPVYGWN